MSRIFLKTLGFGVVATALILPLGACSDDTKRAAEKTIEQKKQALEHDKEILRERAAAAEKRVEEKLDADKAGLDQDAEKLKKEVDERSEAAKERLEKRAANVKDNLDRNLGKTEEAIDAREQELDRELQKAREEVKADADALEKNAGEGDKRPEGKE